MAKPNIFKVRYCLFVDNLTRNHYKVQKKAFEHFFTFDKSIDFIISIYNCVLSCLFLSCNCLVLC